MVAVMWFNIDHFKKIIDVWIMTKVQLFTYKKKILSVFLKVLKKIKTCTGLRKKILFEKIHIYSHWFKWKMKKDRRLKKLDNMLHIYWNLFLKIDEERNFFIIFIINSSLHCRNSRNIFNSSIYNQEYYSKVLHIVHKLWSTNWGCMKDLITFSFLSVPFNLISVQSVCCYRAFIIIYKWWCVTLLPFFSHGDRIWKREKNLCVWWGRALIEA